MILPHAAHMTIVRDKYSVVRLISQLSAACTLDNVLTTCTLDNVLTTCTLDNVLTTYL